MKIDRITEKERRFLRVFGELHQMIPRKQEVIISMDIG
jgi:hypothetical protein